MVNPLYIISSVHSKYVHPIKFPDIAATKVNLL